MSRLPKMIFWLMSWCVGQLIVGYFTKDAYVAMSFFGIWVMLFDRLTE